MDGGSWTPSSRNQYNLVDAVSRSTTQVFYTSTVFVDSNISSQLKCLLVFY